MLENLRSVVARSPGETFGEWLARIPVEYQAADMSSPLGAILTDHLKELYDLELPGHIQTPLSDDKSAALKFLSNLEQFDLCVAKMVAIRALALNRFDADSSDVEPYDVKKAKSLVVMEVMTGIHDKLTCCVKWLVAQYEMSPEFIHSYALERITNSKHALEKTMYATFLGELFQSGVEFDEKTIRETEKTIQNFGESTGLFHPFNDNGESLHHLSCLLGKVLARVWATKPVIPSDEILESIMAEQFPAKSIINSIAVRLSANTPFAEILFDGIFDQTAMTFPPEFLVKRTEDATEEDNDEEGEEFEVEFRQEEPVDASEGSDGFYISEDGTTFTDESFPLISLFRRNCATLGYLALENPDLMTKFLRKELDIDAANLSVLTVVTEFLLMNNLSDKTREVASEKMMTLLDATCDLGDYSSLAPMVAGNLIPDGEALEFILVRIREVIGGRESDLIDLLQPAVELSSRLSQNEKEAFAKEASIVLDLLFKHDNPSIKLYASELSLNLNLSKFQVRAIAELRRETSERVKRILRDYQENESEEFFFEVLASVQGESLYGLFEVLGANRIQLSVLDKTIPLIKSDLDRLKEKFEFAKAESKSFQDELNVGDLFEPGNGISVSGSGEVKILNLLSVPLGAVLSYALSVADKNAGWKEVYELALRHSCEEVRVSAASQLGERDNFLAMKPYFDVAFTDYTSPTVMRSAAFSAITFGEEGREYLNAFDTQRVPECVKLVVREVLASSSQNLELSDVSFIPVVEPQDIQLWAEP